jgi:hypothetical protein
MQSGGINLKGTKGAGLSRFEKGIENGGPFGERIDCASAGSSPRQGRHRASRKAVVRPPRL